MVNSAVAVGFSLYSSCVENQDIVFIHVQILSFTYFKNFYQYEVDNLAGNSFSLESLLLSKFLRNVDSNYVMLWMECQFFDSDYMHVSHKSKLHMTLTFKLIFEFLFF